MWSSRSLRNNVRTFVPSAGRICVGTISGRTIHVTIRDARHVEFPTAKGFLRTRYSRRSTRHTEFRAPPTEIVFTRFRRSSPDNTRRCIFSHPRYRVGRIFVIPATVRRVFSFATRTADRSGIYIYIRYIGVRSTRSIYIYVCIYFLRTRADIRVHSSTTESRVPSFIHRRAICETYKSGFIANIFRDTFEARKRNSRTRTNIYRRIALLSAC